MRHGRDPQVGRKTPMGSTQATSRAERGAGVWGASHLYSALPSRAWSRVFCFISCFLTSIGWRSLTPHRPRPGGAGRAHAARSSGPGGTHGHGCFRLSSTESTATTLYSAFLSSCSGLKIIEPRVDIRRRDQYNAAGAAVREKAINERKSKSAAQTYTVYENVKPCTRRIIGRIASRAVSHLQLLTSRMVRV